MVQAGSRKSFPVSWDQFHRDARALAWRLADKGPFEAIVCITRGGLVPAAIVARELELKLVETVCVASYHDYSHQGDIEVLKTISPSVAAIGNGRGKGVLLIDDLTDTRKTAKLVPAPAPPAPPDVEPTTAAAASLSARLHSLETVFSPLASNLAHPRELEDQPQFAEAVRLLQDSGVPLDTVMQYALGANWPLACAGLAALQARADRSERANEDVAQFEKLYPWPIYFALKCLIVVEPRPPVGDPVAG